MSKYFDTRTPLTITVGEKTHIYFVRELGYLEFDSMKKSVELELPTGASKEKSGAALMQTVVLACVENEDGSPSYTAEEWRKEIEEVFMKVVHAAMAEQGIDLSRRKDAEPEVDLTEEELAGNDEPSRTSGENSPSSSAAVPLVN